LFAQIGDPGSCWMLEHHYIKSEADLDKFIYDFIHFPLGKFTPGEINDGGNTNQR